MFVRRANGRRAARWETARHVHPSPFVSTPAGGQRAQRDRRRPSPGPPVPARASARQPSGGRARAATGARKAPLVPRTSPRGSSGRGPAARRPAEPPGPGGRGARIFPMRSDMEPTRSHTPVVRKAAAGVVLVVAAAILVKVIIGVVAAVFWTVVVIAAVLAVLWALKTIVW
jgi:hypothetical protein